MGQLTSAQQIMEEELQQSLRENEENADYDSNEDAPGEEEDVDAEGEEFDEDVNIYAENVQMEVEEQETAEEDEEQDADGSAESGVDSDEEGSDEEGSDEDAEADDDENYDEVDDEIGAAGEAILGDIKESQREDSEGDEDVEDAAEEEEEDDEEGVGAVKLRPGETDEEEEEESEASEASEGESFHAESDAHSEGEAEWEDAVENEDEDEDEDDDESGTAPAKFCIFCKQDEDHDPSEQFEPFLTCSSCGESAHQQCARDNTESKSRQNSKTWTCPECAGSSQSEDDEDAPSINGIINADSPPATRRATAPKLARDLLPSQRGAVKPDSHSVFNQLVLDDDPMDGSRVLRKRKTSSIDGEEHIANLRKRRKNTGDSHSIEDVAVTNDADEENGPRSARSLRLKISTNAPATIVKKTRSKLVLRFRVAPTELKSIVLQPPKPQKRGGGRRTRGARIGRPVGSRNRRRAATPPLAPFAPISQPFYSFFDKDMDDKGKPYGGILTEAEADTSKTLPTPEDRRRFDEAKQKAEEDWKERLLAMQAEIDVPVRKSKKSAGPASQIECVEFGGWEIDTWYAAPYPEEYSRNRVLFICEFCLKYMNSDYVAWRHKLKCPAKHPPGDEIYRSGSISVFEVDGRKNPVYCQNLCLLAKLFLGSKTLYYDVEPFLFYVLCEYDDLGYHFVGYFSKEKRASSQNNVSCILTLPIHQRKGYGNLLIDFSYLLTRVEGKCGSPEKPLSDMGLVSYRNYWRLVMCRYLIQQVSEDRHEKRGLSIKKISDDTGMTADDVISALEGLRCLVRDPQTQMYAFRVDIEFCRQYIAKWESKNYVQLDPSALTWTPYVMGRSNATNFELAPAMHAIAPREEDDEPKDNDTVIAEVVENGEAVEVPVQMDVNGAQIGVPADAPPLILESTEPNEVDAVDKMGGHDDTNDNMIEEQPKGEEAAQQDTAELPAPGPEDNEKATVLEEARKQAKEEPEGDRENSWILAYKDIPPTRFTVFPPIHGGRRLPASRPPVTPRPPVARTASASRPKPRRSATRRSTTGPKSRSSASRNRKPGGTGRGPGRWPKGTKKSDYGNADSGPGLPPAWLEKQRHGVVPTGASEASIPSESGEVLAQEGTGEVAAADGNSPGKMNGVAQPSVRRSASVGAVDEDGDGDTEMKEAEEVGDGV